MDKINLEAISKIAPCAFEEYLRSSKASGKTLEQLSVIDMWLKEHFTTVSLHHCASHADVNCYYSKVNTVLFSGNILQYQMEQVITKEDALQRGYEKAFYLLNMQMCKKEENRGGDYLDLVTRHAQQRHQKQQFFKKLKKGKK